MIDGALYQPIYLAIVAILTFVTGNRYAAYPQSRIYDNRNQDPVPSAAMMVFMILFIGFRPLHRAFVDMNNYRLFYSVIPASHNFEFDWNAENLIFDNIFTYLATEGVNFSVFIVFMAVVYFGAMWIALRKWFAQDTLYACLIYLAAFSTFSYGTNGIKAGAAASIFMVALAYKENLKLTIILSLLSWFFHHSMMTVIAIYTVTFLVKNPKIYLGGWLFCVACSVIHINPFQSLMVSMTDDTGVNYLLNTNSVWGGKTGFRLDFILYSAVPIAIGYYVIFKKRVNSTAYIQLFNLYLGLNALWALCMYIPFNNRIAYLSWFLLPIVSIYPFMKINLYPPHGLTQYTLLNRISYFYLFFSLFMDLIYYA